MYQNSRTLENGQIAGFTKLVPILRREILNTDLPKKVTNINLTKASIFETKNPVPTCPYYRVLSALAVALRMMVGRRACVTQVVILAR